MLYSACLGLSPSCSCSSYHHLCARAFNTFPWHRPRLFSRCLSSAPGAPIDALGHAWDLRRGEVEAAGGSAVPCSLRDCSAVASLCAPAALHSTIGSLSRSHQGDGKGLSVGRGLPKAAGRWQKGRQGGMAAGGGGAGRSLELPGCAGHVASAPYPTPSRPHGPTRPALGAAGPCPRGSAQPQQRRARHAQMRRRFYISHLLPRHLCHLALSQPGSFLPNDFS